MAKPVLKRRKPQRRKRLRPQRGVAVVEMAVLLPVFLVIILGIVEFGRAYNVEHLLANAARMGARRSVVDGSTNTAVEQMVKDFCVSNLNVSASDITVVITVGTVSGADLSTATTGDLVTLTVSVDFDDVSLIPGSYLGGKQLSDTCVMEHE